MQHPQKKKTKQNKTKKTTSLATSNMQKPELNAYRDGWKKITLFKFIVEERNVLNPINPWSYISC